MLKNYYLKTNKEQEEFDEVLASPRDISFWGGNVLWNSSNVYKYITEKTSILKWLHGICMRVASTQDTGKLELQKGKL